MDPQVHIKDYHKFAVSRNNSGKLRYDSPYNINSKRGVAKLLKHEKLTASDPQDKDLKQLTRILYNTYQDHTRDSRSRDHAKGGPKHEQNRPHERKYDRKGRAKYAQNIALDKNSGYSNANTASDSDSNGSNQYYEMHGFVVVRDGKTLNDNLYEDFDPIFGTDSDDERHVSKQKFASSTMTITPHLHTISIPSFI